MGRSRREEGKEGRTDVAKGKKEGRDPRKEGWVRGVGDGSIYVSLGNRGGSGSPTSWSPCCNGGLGGQRAKQMEQARSKVHVSWHPGAGGTTGWSVITGQYGSFAVRLRSVERERGASRAGHGLSEVGNS